MEDYENISITNLCKRLTSNMFEVDTDATEKAIAKGRVRLNESMKLSNLYHEEDDSLDKMLDYIIYELSDKDKIDNDFDNIGKLRKIRSDLDSLRILIGGIICDREMLKNFGEKLSKYEIIKGKNNHETVNKLRWRIKSARLTAHLNSIFQHSKRPEITKFKDNFKQEINNETSKNV
jgi:hypothetical protein